LALLHWLTVARQAVGVLQDLPWPTGRPLGLGLNRSMSLRLGWGLILLPLSRGHGGLLGSLRVHRLAGKFGMDLRGKLLLGLLLLLSCDRRRLWVVLLLSSLQDLGRKLAR
jgi:hypothetical protein